MNKNKEDFSTCISCSITFDDKTHTPRLIPMCGDTICETCLDKMLKMKHDNLFVCPKDRITFDHKYRGLDAFPINYTLRELIKNNQKLFKNRKKTICHFHGKTHELYCINEKMKLCSRCVDHGHQGHDIMSLEKYEEEKEISAKILENKLQKFEKLETKAKEALEDRKQEFIHIIENQFNEYVRLLCLRKNEMIEDTGKFFDELLEKGFDNNNLFSNIASWKAILNGWIKDLKDPEDDADVEDIQEAAMAIPEEDEEKNFEAMQEYLTKFYVCFEDSFPTMIKECCYFKKVNDKPAIQVEEIKEEQKEAPDILERYGERGNLEKREEDVGLMRINEKKIEPKVEQQLERIARDQPNANFYILENDASNTLYVYSQAAKPIFKMTRALDSLTELTVDALNDYNSLVIDMSYSLFSKQIVADLCYMLINSINAKSIELNISESEILEGELTSLIISFSRIADNLVSLTLNFEEMDITDKKINTLTQDILSEMNNLKELTLNFSSTLLTDKTVEVLMTKAVPRLKKLEKFRLNLTGFIIYTNITDTALDLIETLDQGQNNNISDLDLCFSKTGVSEGRIKQLSKMNRTMRNLGLIKIDATKMRVTGENKLF